MHDRVLDTADVLIDRQPFIGGRFIDHVLRVVWTGKACVVPARLNKGVKGIGLALSWVAALWTSGVDKLWHAFERVAAAIRDDIRWQYDR